MHGLSFAQSFPSNTDKCYSHAKLPEKFYFDTVKYPMYIGDQPEKFKFREKTLVLKQERKYLADDGKKILEEGEYLDIKYLKNTKKVPEEDWKYLDYEVEVKIEAQTLIKEVLCEEEITKEFILNLRRALYHKGFRLDLAKAEINEELIVTLVKFQLQSGLAAGSLDIDTLTKLNLW